MLVYEVLFLSKCINISTELVSGLSWGCRAFKLTATGCASWFRYKYGMEEILDGSIACAVRFGCLDSPKLIVQG